VVVWHVSFLFHFLILVFVAVVVACNNKRLIGEKVADQPALAMEDRVNEVATTVRMVNITVIEIVAIFTVLKDSGT
jgi:hypothetical protein